MSSKFNITKVKRSGFSIIEGYILKFGGIIYGGYVRDEVIIDEYTSKFINKHLKLKKSERIEKYWDVNYHQETLDRLLIPSDIDISFKTEDDLKKFIEGMENSELFYITKLNENTLYGHDDIEINHRTYRATSFIEGTSTRIGESMFFDIDVCVVYREPPFKSCDMYSNCLIKDINGIRISANSGIFPDHLRPYKVAMYTVKVIEMIIKKETYITIDPVDSNISAKRAIRRISKMISKDFTIKNINWLSACKDKSEICMICQNENAEMSIKRGSHFHKKCLIKFFNHAEFFNDDGGYFFNSPLKEKCYIRFIKEWNYE